MWSGHLSLPPSRARCTCPHPRTKTTHGKLEIASGISATPGPSQLGRLASWTGHPSTHPGTKDTVPGWLHAQGGAGLGWLAEPNIFLRICTHTQIITISNDICPPMPTHSMTCVHPCPPIARHVLTHAHSCHSNCAHVFKNCVMFITRLHQILVGLDK
jgi:hypothetical protein